MRLLILVACLLASVAWASDVAVTRQTIDGELEDIQWFGKDQKTVLILTDAHTLYRSSDGGKTFTSQSDKLSRAAGRQGRNSGKLKVRSIVRPAGIGPKASKTEVEAFMQHFMLIGTDLSHWVSGDGGRSYKAVNSDVAFTEAKIHEDMILAASMSPGCVSPSTGSDDDGRAGSGACYKTLHASYDFGATWDSGVLDYVVQFDWARNLVELYNPGAGSQASQLKDTPESNGIKTLNERLEWLRTGKLKTVEEPPRKKIFATAFKTKEGDQQFGIWSPDIHMLTTENSFKDKKELLKHGNRFVFMGRYIFVAVFQPTTSLEAKRHRRHRRRSDGADPSAFDSGPSVKLFVSGDGGSTFDKSKLPMRLRQHEFTILDTSEQSVFLHVNHEGANANYGNVYASDSLGLFYSLTLRKNRRDDSDGKCDFEKVEGLTGVYMANIIAHDDDLELAAVSEDDDDNNDMGEDDSPQFERKSRRRKDGGSQALVKSVVTFDKGGEWSYLNPPTHDVDGKTTSCNPEEGCSLHLHGTTDVWGPMYSSSNALGLVMATGNVGPGLTPHEDQTNTYFSRDGGLEWFEVMKGSHIYEFGDHGGLILMAKDQEATDELLYSHDEGLSWKRFKFSQTKMEVNNIIIERTAAAQQFLVYGVEKDSVSGQHVGVVYFVDFEGLHTRPCAGIEAAGSDDSDYELWTPWDGRYGGKCLLGHMSQYVRRKREKKCFNGINYERPKFIKRCPCVSLDYECDYGFERPAKDSKGPCTAVKREGAGGEKGRSHKATSVAAGDMEGGSSGFLPAQAADEKVASVTQDDVASPHFVAPTCPAAGYYYVTKGYRRVSGDLCLHDAEGATNLEPTKVHCSAGHMGLVFLVLVILVLGGGGLVILKNRSKDNDSSGGGGGGGGGVSGALGVVLTIVMATISCVCGVLALPFSICGICKKRDGQGGGKKDKFAGFGSDDLHAGFTSFTDEPEEYEDVERGGKRGGGRKHINDDDDDDDDLMGDDDDDEDEFDDDVEEDEEDDDDDGDDLDGEAVGNAQPDSMMDLLTG
eukprot:g244.t1